MPNPVKSLNAGFNAGF